MAARRGGSVGLPVVDPQGIELGYVSADQGEFLVLGEGSAGRLRLGRKFVDRIQEKVFLRGPMAEIFAGLNVVDNEGEFVGIVRDTVEADDVLDSLIVEDEGGQMVNVLLEDVRTIGEWVELSVTGESLEN
jgi:sporulation protein YlmC with PRC-barrel domain